MGRKITVYKNCFFLLADQEFTMRKIMMIFTITTALLLLLSGNVLATAAKTPDLACTWNGTTGNWSDIARWNNCGGHAPGASDSATITSGTVTLDVDVTVQDLAITGGTLTGSYSIIVTNSMAWSGISYMSGSGTTTLASGATGTITTSWGNPNDYPVLDTRTLNIAGSMVLNGNQSVEMNNAATIAIVSTGIFDFQSNGGLTNYTGAAGVVNNSGMLKKTAGTGTSTINLVAVNNTGTVQGQAGTLKMAGGGSSTGSFTASSGGTVDFGGGTHGVTLGVANSISGAGTISFSGGTTTISGSGSYAVTGTTFLGNNGGTANLNMNGTTANLTITGGTLAGSGTLTVTSSMAWSGISYMSGSGTTTLASGATGTITTSWGNPNDYPVLDTRTLSIAGTVAINGSRYLQMNNAGMIAITATGILDFQSDAGLTNYTGTAGIVNNGGILKKSTGTGTSTINIVHVNNTGTVQAQSGTLSFADFTQSSGVTMLEGGSIATSGNPLTFNGGSLQGVGTISGNVVNTGGTVAPGSSAGILHLVGNYTQGLAGSLDIQLGGADPGSGYDVLDVSGSVTLSGTLNISLINSYTPVEGNSFTIMNFSSRSGDFTTYTGTDIGNWLILLPSYDSSHLTLTAHVLVADLSITITDGNEFAITGKPIVYTIVVTNAGPDPAVGATVIDTLPNTVINVTWTCAATGGSCSSPGGSGDLNTSVNLNSGGTATFTISGWLALSARDTLTNDASVSHGADSNPSNNSASDSDIVLWIKGYFPLIIKD
jgi:uncharacterized repeat protein (TIGR01451 family)